jgi:hypothetical protein
MHGGRRFRRQRMPQRTDFARSQVSKRIGLQCTRRASPVTRNPERRTDPSGRIPAATSRDQTRQMEVGLCRRNHYQRISPARAG